MQLKTCYFTINYVTIFHQITKVFNKGENMKSFKINENDSGQRIDRFIKKVTVNMSDSLINKYLRLKRIKVNGKKAVNNQKLEVNDLVEMYINDEFFLSDNSASFTFLKAPAKLNIVYEDENIILCDKPSGLVVHEDNDNETDTLINRILHYLYDNKEYNPYNENSFTPALCNRIDRNTGGIVIGAKNAEALRIVNALIKERLIEKRYLLIANGTLPKKHDTVKSFMEKNDNTNTVKVYDYPKEGAKTAITEYKVLDEKNGYTLADVILHTGRTHQIRAQMAHMGCPLLGDGKYGVNRNDKKLGFKYQALYSYKLCFRGNEKSEKLAYLNDREFEVKDIWLLKEFEKLS